MAAGDFKGGPSEMHSEMSEVKSQLATILAALSGGSRKRTQVIEESYDTSNRDNDTPAKTPPRKAKK